MSPFDVAGVFKAELDKAVEAEAKHSGFPVSDWFWSGPRDGAASVQWWHENGPAMVDAFVDWFEHNPDVEIWRTPDGIPAIELPLEVMFGSVPVKMILDVVFQIGTALVVCDVKTSAKMPVSHRQLGIYACGLELAYGKAFRPRYGTFFMNRGTGPRGGPKVHFQRPVELGRPQYSVAYLAAEFEQAEKGIQGGVFPASPGEGCGRCGAAWACTEVNGPKAAQFDPNYPNYPKGR